jgi:hypothetical protein
MMRDAARALDDVSDHLGEVLRRADDLLAEWSRFGAQVRGQVEREAAAIGEVVEGAIGRVGAAGIDRAIGDRLRALTVEIEKLEQRARAASRAAVEQRDADRRILWGVVAGVVLANALLLVLILRRPESPPVAEPIRIDPPAPAVAPVEAPVATPDPAQAATGSGAAVPAANPGGGAAAVTAGAGTVTPAGGTAPAAAAAAGGTPPAGGAAGAKATGSPTAPGGKSAGASPPAATAAGASHSGNGAETQGGRASDASKAAPIALPPPKPGAAHHKKLP